MMSGVNRKVMVAACLATLANAISLKMESAIDPSVFAIEGQQDLGLVPLEENTIGWYNDDYYHWWHIVYMATIIELFYHGFLKSKSIDPCCKLPVFLFLLIRCLVLLWQHGWPSDDIFEQYDTCWYCLSGTTFELTEHWRNYGVVTGGYMLFLYWLAIDAVVRLALGFCKCGCLSTAFCCAACYALTEDDHKKTDDANSTQDSIPSVVRLLQVDSSNSGEAPVAIEMV